MLIRSEPTQICELCGSFVVVVPDGRGFPPNIAKNKLKKICKTNDCPSKPKYTAGVSICVKDVTEQ